MTSILRHSYSILTSALFACRSIYLCVIYIRNKRKEREKHFKIRAKLNSILQMREGPWDQPGNSRKRIRHNNQMHRMREGPWGRPGSDSKCTWLKEKIKTKKFILCIDYLRYESTLRDLICIIASLTLMRICARALTLFAHLINEGFGHAKSRDTPNIK